MRQQKNNSRIILVILASLFLLLNIPKVLQLNTLLSTMLTPDEMDFFISYRSFFILLGIILELIGAMLNIFILKYIYYSAKAKISLINNINIYLAISNITKFISIFIPKSILSVAPFVNSILFAGFYIAFHYQHDKDKTNTKLQWSILLSYPLINLVFSIL